MRERLEQILLEVSWSSEIDAGNLDHAGLLILQSTLRGLRISRAGIWIIDDACQSIKSRLLFDDGEVMDGEPLLLTAEQFPAYFEGLRAERTIAADDAETHPATHEFTEVYLRPLGITSMLDAPIRHRGRMVGVICAEHQGEPRTWSEDELVFAGAMADAYGRALSAHQRAVSEAELQRVNAELEQRVEERTASLKRALLGLEEAHERLVESEKMAALGTLVAGVAHEVNTPLGVALTAASHCEEELSVLKKSFQSGELEEAQFVAFVERMGEGLAMMGRNLHRAAELVQSFKRTAADQTVLEADRFELGEYVRATLASLGPALRSAGVVVRFQLDDGLDMHAYPGAIAQILTNLVTNSARHAFPDAHTGPKEVRVAASADGDSICVTFEDTGVGLNEEQQRRLFEPFFTTARGRGGTGLGMAIVYNLVTQKLGGTLVADSELGRGLRVAMVMPRVSPQVALTSRVA